MKLKIQSCEITKDTVIALAWDDQASFEEIYRRTGLREKEVKVLMRKELKRGSYVAWRKRVQGRKAKHRKRTKCLEDWSREA